MAPAAIGIRLVRAIATLLLVLCAVALPSWPASPASAEWFGDLYAGGAFTERADLNVGSDTFRNVSFDTSGLVGGRVGYWIGDFEYLGAAFDVLHYRPRIDAQTVRLTTFDPSTTHLSSIDVGVTALSFDFIVRVPLLKDEAFPFGRLQPYGLVGPILAITQAADSNNFGPPTGQSHVSSQPGFNVGTGLLWQFHRHVGVFGEYRYLQFSPDFNFAPSTEVQFNVRSHVLMGGVSVRF